MKYILSLIFLVFVLFGNSFSQTPDDNTLPKNEIRAVWVSTVLNLDWPGSTGVNAARFQKQELLEYFDRLKEAGINAIMFQIRTESDALYQSNYEPWSRYLTGTMGVAPNPFWDPLTFAIQEAHKRGMELHAWMNPYRAVRDVSTMSKAMPGFEDDFPSISTATEKLNETASFYSDTHVSKAHPEWMLYCGNIGILNPGHPEVIQYIVNVVMDVVNRYNIDGVHFDDYFYPYAPDNIKNEDAETFAEYPRGFTDIKEWRRDNVNLMMATLNDSIKSVKPFVKFGISPFGRHEEGYNTLYADAYQWIEAGSIDYLTPQLYWESSRFYTGTDFKYLYDLWYSHRSGRHVYAGHGLYRADKATYGSTLFKPTEVPNQIIYMREHGENTGSFFFRSRNITTYSSGGIVGALKTDLYKYPALSPTMDWLPKNQPPAPSNLSVNLDSENDHLVHLSWERPVYNNGNDTTLRFAVYTFSSADGVPSDLEPIINNSYYFAGFTGETSFEHTSAGGNGETYYFVTSVSSNSIESEVAEVISAGVITSNEQEISGIPSEIELLQNYPNPFNPSTQISFTLTNAQPVSLTVYNVLGQTIKVLANQQVFAAGKHALSFDAAGLPTGMYFYTLNAGSTSFTKKMMLVK